MPNHAQTTHRTPPQAGITNRPPEHLLLVALHLTGSDPRATIEALRGIVHRELTSDLDDLGPADQPPAETGELDFDDGYDRQHLTITVGFGRHTYDLLGVPADDVPQDLIDIPWAQLGDSPEARANGDVVLQICSDSAYINEHVLRRVEEELRGLVQVVWVHTGAQRYSSRAGRTSRREGRAWIGFLDGTHNLNPRRSEEDAKLVFVDPDAVGSYPRLPQPGQPGYPGSGPSFPPDLRQPPLREPAWTRNGSYMTVRVSVNALDTWDQQALGSQEQTVGQHKKSGISLDLDEATAKLGDDPAYFNNAGDVRVPLDSHVRKANPHAQPDDAARRIFRRGYPLYEAAGAQGLLRGLAFISFGRTFSTQFEFVTRAWLNNPNFPQPNAGVDRLRQFDSRVLAGGYYFVPPLANQRQPSSWVVPPVAG